MPNLHCEAITFPSSDGKHTSSAFLYTVPGQPVRAVLQLSHGMCEYVRRYAPMAEFYAAHGIALAGNDHLGHGDTAQAGEHGHYGEPNGCCHLLNDLHTMNRILHERFPDTPIILYGHSMGSFYARWYAEKWPESITALVISGTAGPSFMNVVGQRLAGVAMALLALASAVSLLVVLAICFFIEIQQFYRLLGERGYLMLALPVPIWQHIAAKVICGTVWTLFGMVFFTLCGMLTTDTVSGSGFALDFSRVTAEDVAIWSAMLLIILALIAGALLHAYLACAFAAQFTQQRLLISIAAYFVIGFIGQMAALVTAVFVAFHGYKYLNNTNFSAASFFGPDNTLGVIVLTLLAVFALIALVDALLWALTQWLMTKRLNLA